MKNAEDISDYLQDRAGHALTQVKTVAFLKKAFIAFAEVYTYDQWMIRLGEVQASIGLQMSMYLDALSFLNVA